MASMSISGVTAALSAFEQLKQEFGAPANGNTVMIVGTNVEYAAYVELGTSRMKAQPYLFPAARQVARDPGKHVGSVDSVDDFVREVALAIEREAKKKARVDTGRLQASIEATKVN